MEIIAKTEDGALVQATDKELKEIIRSVTGKEPKEIHVGIRIPAIDYASTITKIKALKDDYYFKQIGLSLKS